MQDSSRQHYEPAELKVFENIECEWPLFLILLLLDSLISGDQNKAREYRAKLDKIVPVNKEGLAIVPELYLVPRKTVRQSICSSITLYYYYYHVLQSLYVHNPIVNYLFVIVSGSWLISACQTQVDLECSEPHSQERVMGPKIQHMWSQSLFILCNLLEANLLNIGEIDPLNRRYSMLPQPDTLVQGELVCPPTVNCKYVDS